MCAGCMGSKDIKWVRNHLVMAKLKVEFSWEKEENVRKKGTRAIKQKLMAKDQ